jgi:signal transduction histidine kinase
MSPLKGSSGGFVKVARDLTEKQKAEEELRQAREELELRVGERTKELDKSNKALKQEVLERTRSEHERVALLRRIVTTQEDERGRIARDLHDQLGQRLTALRLKIASLKDACALDKELHARVRHIEQIGARLDSEVSFLAWELRPRALDDLGLVSAVESFVGEWSQHFDIPAEFHSRGVAGKRLEPEIETNLYRITQEALNNISKHAQASTANVILESRNNEIVLVVEDNGVGFDVSQVENGARSSGRLGLLGMNERAAISGGKIEIESAKGAGTTVFVRVPAKFATNGDHNGS